MHEEREKIKKEKFDEYLFEKFKYDDLNDK